MNVMSITQGSEMLHSYSGHIGTSSLSSTVYGQNGINPSEGKNTDSFKNYLLSAISEVNSQQLDVNRVQEQLITDPDSVDIHDVTTAMAKAQMSLSLAQTVIDRLVTGWSEISTTR